MATDGLNFFNDGANDFIQRLSVGADQLDGAVGGVVSDVVNEAVEIMRQVVMSGGEQATKKGGPRIDSGDMYNAIDGEVLVNGRGRIQANFGFINGAPEYTIYQERGTRTIPPMLAYAQAQERVITELWNELDQGRWIPASLRF